jgi:glycosidase
MRLLIAGLCLFALSACAPKSGDGAPSSKPGAADPFTPKPYVELQNADWTRKAVLYQINIRQFTPEGTFRAAQAQLPRVKELGVDILWIMPIHPIGEKNRKGSLGSPYSVRDYYGVNPEFGTKEDFKAFVDAAHAAGFKVILDWVANHTAWDNPLVTEHPDWYARDWKGDFHPTPWWDWSDIIDLDYSQRDLREYMTKAMVYWVKEMGVDGFRCDVAGYVPLDFWEEARRQLDAIKPVFMLAEWDQRDAHARAFDASYAWGWNNAVHAITKGEADTGALYGYYSGNESAWPMEAMRMVYTSNHDQNAWDGTDRERFGAGLEAAMALSFTGEGIPSVYNGQEAGESKRLAFFERDPIVWQDHPHRELLKKLIAFRKANPALDNGAWGARMVGAGNTNAKEVFSFVRQKDGNKVLVAINFSPEPQDIQFTDALARGTFVEFATGQTVSIEETSRLKLDPWGFRMFAAGGRQ